MGAPRHHYEIEPVVFERLKNKLTKKRSNIYFFKGITNYFFFNIFVSLLGGCTKNGSLIFTFTDNCGDKEIKAENYRKAVDYYCNIPS